jgi:hypothetical protein
MRKLLTILCLLAVLVGCESKEAARDRILQRQLMIQMADQINDMDMERRFPPIVLPGVDIDDSRECRQRW